MGINYMWVTMIVSAVVELGLFLWLVWNLTRYKFLGNKYVYAGISFLCCFLYALFINNHEEVSFLNVLGSIFDSFKAAVGSLDKDKLEFLQTYGSLGAWFKNAFTAVSLITLAYLSIAVVLSFIKAFKVGWIRKVRHLFTKRDVYYIFTDSRNETALPLATKLNKEKNSVNVFVSRASLKTQEGNEFKDMLVGKDVCVRAENFSDKFCKKVFNKSFFWIRHNAFKKSRRYFVYLLLSNDETTTYVADCFKTAIEKNKVFKKWKPNLTTLTDQQMNDLDRIKVFIAYQNTDIDLLHNYSSKTLHIVNTLSKYDMISTRFLFDNPINNFIDLNKVDLEKDNDSMHVTMLGFGVINKPIFEKMTYSYQLFGDNINKVQYHILDRYSDSLVKAYQNEFTDKKAPLYLYSVEAACDGEDLRDYETIDRYIKSIVDNPNRFNKDGFEIFVISVINSNNDLNIATNLRRAIIKYVDEDDEKSKTRKNTYIFVRVGEDNIENQFVEANKSFAFRNVNVFDGLDVAQREKAGIPIILFGNDNIMNEYLNKQYHFVDKCAYIAWESYLSNTKKPNAKYNWLLEGKSKVNTNTEYVHSIRTKLGMLGIKIDKDFNPVFSTDNYDEYFDKKYFHNEEYANESIVKLANLEHNRWAQASNLGFRYRVDTIKDKKATEIFDYYDGEQNIETKFEFKTRHICMVTNKELLKLYDDLLEKNKEIKEDYSDLCYKLVYGNDINQLKLFIEHFKK